MKKSGGGSQKMKKNKENSPTFIIKIGLDEIEKTRKDKDKKEYRKDHRDDYGEEKKKVELKEKEKVRIKERVIDRTDSDSMLSYSRKDWGGYSPAQLVSKLETAKDAIANGNARQALMNLDSCIVRISNRELPSNKNSDVYPAYQYELNQVLPDPGKA